MLRLALIGTGIITAHFCMESFDAKTIDFGIVMAAITGGLIGWLIFDIFTTKP